MSAQLPAAVREVSHSFSGKPALQDVSLALHPGQVHALLGPNGAGKTTLLRVLCGLLRPQKGSVDVLGFDATESSLRLRQYLGLVPSGDRSFYLRLSGLENLVFFARLNGMRRRSAVARSREVLEQVELDDVAGLRVGKYSHGMQKRLSFARAILTRPKVLLVDEATHDLDPKRASTVRDLTKEFARNGAGVVWATQRLDEIRGFADVVTLLDKGHVRFAGSVPELMAHSLPSRYLLRIRNGGASREALHGALEQALSRRGTISMVASADAEHYLLSLSEGTVLGDAVAALAATPAQILSCREERSEVEEAFLALTEERAY